ncbi:repetitive proline-rich cell wall protein 1-like [Daphnia pulicaria]|uniref:repetitive proline-rich cell wall protein 1-like n=1 Tax=Daphnia pulicaria TaxID=35523 RepID=UPI001EEBEE00|nr:repetitive proline-rich cell wall protein 1-like [Daphnia pulicaria]
MNVIVLAVLLSVAAAQNAYYPKAAYKTPEYPAQPYSFEWAVKDAESYNDYSHSESSDGKVTSGSYRVVLPDGRTQIVTYKDDSYGYVADVRYEGEARYPEYKPATSYPAYKASPVVYKAPEAPVYKAPVYEAPVVPDYRPTEAPVVVYKAPSSPTYSAPAPKLPTAPTYKAPESPMYRATTYTVPSYKPTTTVAPPVYEAPTYTVPSYQPTTPVYEAPTYVVPSYKPSTTAAPVYEAPVTPATYRAPSPAPVPLLYRANAKKTTY